MNKHTYLSIFVSSLLMQTAATQADEYYSVTNYGRVYIGTRATESIISLNNRGDMIIRYRSGIPSSSNGSFTIIKDGVSAPANCLPEPTNRGCIVSKINDRGQYIGSSGQNYSSGLNYRHAFITTKDVVTDLGTLGWDHSAPVDINNKGHVAGTIGNYSTSESGLTTIGGLTHAFLYKEKTMFDLGTLGGTNSYALGINDKGQVIGMSEIDQIDDNGSTIQHAFLFDDNEMIDLGDYSPIDINKKGQIILNGSDGAYTYQKGAMKKLGSYSAIDINDKGEIILNSIEYPYHAYTVRKGKIIDLGTLGGTDSSAVKINNKGQIIGQSSNAESNSSRPFVTIDGIMVDVNSLIDPGLGWTISSVSHINDRGQITGTGYIGAPPTFSTRGKIIKVLLTPPDCRDCNTSPPIENTEIVAE